VEAADYDGARKGTHDDAVKADQASDDRYVAPAIHPATPALYIKNLMRPLGNAVLEEYLVDLATPPSQQPNPDVVVEFYVDNIKSHAFVQFDSVSAASRVRSALHDQVWPDERNRKALWVDFIPAEKVGQWIEKEKGAGQGRGNFNRFEVIYEADDEGNTTARLEELGPEAARQNARAPPTGPASSAIPTGPRGFGVEGAPLGPRGNGGRMGPPSGPRGVSQLEEGFKQTQTHPQLLWKPVSEDLAMRRIDNMRSHYTTDRYRDLGKPDEINRYFFENRDQFVDRGKEVFVGIRPPHREAEKRRAAAGGNGAGRRGLPPAGRDVDRYVGGRSSGRDDFAPRSRFDGAPLPTFEGRSDRRGRNGGYRR
jgi:SAP domain-containing ribonucleoprotein